MLAKIVFREYSSPILARASRASKIAGSARAEKKTSRLDPIPSKLEPVSKAEITVIKRANPIKNKEEKVPLKTDNRWYWPDGD
jgi:hypothetical protein